MTYYLTKFPPRYRDYRWWSAKSKKRAEAFLKHVKEKYGIDGKMILVFEKPTNKTMKKAPKIKINIWKAKDGYRWNMKRSGRIIAESGEAYARVASLKRTLVNLLNCIESVDYDIFYTTT